MITKCDHDNYTCHIARLSERVQADVNALKRVEAGVYKLCMLSTAQTYGMNVACGRLDEALAPSKRGNRQWGCAVTSSHHGQSNTSSCKSDHPAFLTLQISSGQYLTARDAGRCQNSRLKRVHKLKFVVGIAVVAPHWVCAVGGFKELAPMPLGAIVISATTSCAIATRNELSEMLVATSTRPLHGPSIVAVKHMLHRVDAQKSIVARRVVTMEVIISILDVQERHVGLGSLPANG